MKLLLSPIDTWFFRDSTPFDMGESPQAGVRALFPPYPSTVAGALRAALARCNGWDGRGRWPSALERVLGDGPDDLGRLELTGPLLLHDGLPIFRMPRHVLGCVKEGRWTPTTVLRPGAARTVCDLGTSTRLPQPSAGTSDASAVAVGATHWVTRLGLLRVLSGDPPRSEEVLDDSDIWVAEPRVGISRNRTSRVVEEGELYSTWHVRLRPAVCLGVETTGVPANWNSPVGSTVPLGGESRLAACDPWEVDVALQFDEIGAPDRVILVALTPVFLERDVMLGRSVLDAGGGVRVVCAAADRPLRVGGWDSIQRRPLPLRNALAPGSTLFCNVEQPKELGRSVKRGLLRVGHATAAGFGLCAVARAPTWETTT